MAYLPKKIYSSDGWRDKNHIKISYSSNNPSGPKIKRPKINFWRLFKKYLPQISFIFFGGLLILIGLFAWYSKDLPDPGKLLDRDVAQSTKIFDRTGEHLLYEIHGDQKRTLIPLQEIPDYAVKATLALEDQKFYEHGGFSVSGMIRGLFLAPLKGGRAQGGSTLTQQLVKNAILTNERKLKRKVKELVLSYQIERKYTKDEILQLYFNEIPYGSTAYGIEAASQNYFGKSVREITLAEAALLAALPQRPSYLSPYGSHTEELFGRQQYALSQMAKLGFITEAEAEAAKNEKIVFRQKIDSITAPHFVFYIKEILSEKYGEKMVEQGGLKIISTLDYDLQKKAEEIVKEQAEKNQEKYEASNASLVSLDVKTGQIIALVGSRDFFNEEIDGQVNIAVSPRQPGSSFKPLVYTAAWEKGYVPETVVYDLETVFPTEQKNYVPHNYDLKERGPISLRQALAGSLNIPAVKMLYLVGINNVLDLADKIGYTTLKDRSRFGLSLVLGGGEVTLLEHLNAFATFSREGKFLPTTGVLKVENNAGQVLEEFRQEKGEKIIEPNVARITNDVLSDNGARAYIFGANNRLTLPGRQVAAKTGTTNDYHDAWTLGYTSSIATGVWVGNSDNSEMKRGADGSVVAAPIWQKFMIEATKDKGVESFAKPTYEIPNKPMLGGDASGLKVKIDRLTGLLANENTPAHLIEERTYKQAHSILHYVDKNNPLGASPQNPEKDPYYTYWEDAVKRWAEKNGIVNETPPTEYDNLHNLQDSPQVIINSPGDNTTISQNEINIDVSAYSPKNTITKVEYYLGDTLLGTNYQSPYNYSAVIPETIMNGSTKLKVIAYDNVENVGWKEINLNLQRENYINISWLQPNNSTTLNQSSFPYDLLLYIDQIDKVRKVDFYYQPVDGDSIWFGFTDVVSGNNLAYTWQEPPPENGTYQLYPLITDNLNRTIAGPALTISLE